MPALIRDLPATRNQTARPAKSEAAVLAETKTALWCLKQWWGYGAPLEVTFPGIGTIDLTEMLRRLSEDIERGIEVAGQEKVSALARQFGMEVELAG